MTVTIMTFRRFLRTRDAWLTNWMKWYSMRAEVILSWWKVGFTREQRHCIWFPRRNRMWLVNGIMWHDHKNHLTLSQWSEVIEWTKKKIVIYINNIINTTKPTLGIWGPQLFGSRPCDWISWTSMLKLPKAKLSRIHCHSRLTCLELFISSTRHVLVHPSMLLLLLRLLWLMLLMLLMLILWLWLSWQWQVKEKINHKSCDLLRVGLNDLWK